MASADRCYETLEAVLPWLPAVLALSANSPFLEGEATGMWSNRSAVLAELPRAGAPPAFGSYAAWEAWVERLNGVGLLPDYTRLWWDVRPHPRFGTLEIRMPDQPTSLGNTAAFVALIQALCAAALDWAARPDDAASRAVYQQNRWAALRFGPTARLAHPDGDRAETAVALATELVGRLRDTARALGSERLLDGLDPEACEGDRQLEVGRQDGLDAVCADLVTRSLASAW
jgi:carboxylate-amine ligase